MVVHDVFQSMVCKYILRIYNSIIFFRLNFSFSPAVHGERRVVELQKCLRAAMRSARKCMIEFLIVFLKNSLQEPCIEICLTGCKCKAGFKLSKDGSRCVKSCDEEDKCKLPNEEWNDCGSGCGEKTCADKPSTEPVSLLWFFIHSYV